MNSDTSRAGSGGEENSWETLAEDLFGINLGAGPAGEGMVTPEDLSLDEPESSPSPAKAAKSEPSATPPQGTGSTPPKKRSPDEGRSGGRRVPPRRPVPQAEDEFGADLGLEEPAAGESQRGDLDDVMDDDVIEIEDEMVIAEEAGDDEAGARPAAEEPLSAEAKDQDESDDDPYWDTLKTWQWGEEESEPADRSENRPRPGQRGGRGGPRRSGGRERSGPRDRPGQGGGGPRPRRGESRSEGRGERRREERPASRASEPPAERARRQQPAPPAHPESEEASDFGAGLLDEQSSAEPVRGGDAWQTRGPSEGRRSREESAEPDESAEVTGEGESAEQTDSDRPPRRRRRRRRPRSRRERTGESAERQGPSDRGDDVESEIDEQAADEHATDEDASDEHTTDEDATDEQDIDEQAADESPVEEESGADVSRRSERDEPTGPRRRRRRRRPGDRGPRRGPSSERPPIEDEADEARPIEMSMGSASNFDDDEDDEDNVDLEADGGAEGEADDEAPRVYRNVPTWEEAIGYLLHRRPGETRGREGDSRGDRRDGGRRPDRGERPRD